MKHIKLGELDVSRIGLGAMGMSAAYTGAGTDDAGSIRTIHRALELGVTFIDTAETYGPFTNEELLGRAIKGHRDQIVLATKFGRISHARGGTRILDSSPANIRTAAEGSLKRLGTDHIDLYYQTASPPPRSRTRSARWPNWSPRARSVTRPVRGRARHDPPRPRRPPGHRAAVGVLPVDRDPEAEVLPLTRRAGIGSLPLAAGPRLPHRGDPVHRAVR